MLFDEFLSRSLCIGSPGRCTEQFGLQVGLEANEEGQWGTRL